MERILPRLLTALGLAAVSFVLVACYASISISPTSLPETVTGQAYTAALTAASTDGSEVVAMSVIGTLPPGLGFEFERGVGGTISGTPSASGTYTFKVTADGNHFNFGGPHGERAYTIVVH
jgi:hypothetical protein